MKHGYVERVGNAYRVTDKVNIPELQSKLQFCSCSGRGDAIASVRDGSRMAEIRNPASYY